MIGLTAVASAAIAPAAVPVVEPLQHLGDAPDLIPRGQRRARHHQHGHTERARCVQFGLRATATGVFAHHKVDPVCAQQGDVARLVERAARDDDRVLRQGRRLVGCIDESQDVVVLRLHVESDQVHAAQRQQHALWCAAERCGSSRQVGHGLPAVVRLGLPGLACQRQQGNASLRAGCDGIGAHARRKRMGGVDDVGHAFVLQMTYEASHTAEAADTHGNRLRSGLRHPAGIRQRGVLATFGQGQRQRTGFGRAAQDQDIAYG